MVKKKKIVEYKRQLDGTETDTNSKWSIFLRDRTKMKMCKKKAEKRNKTYNNFPRTSSRSKKSFCEPQLYNKTP